MNRALFLSPWFCWYEDRPRLSLRFSFSSLPDLDHRNSFFSFYSCRILRNRVTPFFSSPPEQTAWLALFSPSPEFPTTNATAATRLFLFAPSAPPPKRCIQVYPRSLSLRLLLRTRMLHVLSPFSPWIAIRPLASFSAIPFPFPPFNRPERSPPLQAMNN